MIQRQIDFLAVTNAGNQAGRQHTVQFAEAVVEVGGDMDAGGRIRVEGGNEAGFVQAYNFFKNTGYSLLLSGKNPSSLAFGQKPSV